MFYLIKASVAHMAPGSAIVNTASMNAKMPVPRQIAYSGHNRCNTVRAVSNAHVVIQERSDWAVLVGRPCPHQMIAIYELDDEGLIVRWREYINMADLDRKRGVKAEVAHVETAS